MMCVIPLAGPDFERPDGSTKAEVLIDGRPLLRRVLNDRPWRDRIASGDYVFVFRDLDISRRFASTLLSQWYPEARTVFLSDYAQGAAFSAAAGIALLARNEPLIVDLADIEFSCTADPTARFAEEPTLGAIALTFESDNPSYSYILENDAGEFVRAAEKDVISSHASAGVYLFRNPPTYFHALAHSLDQPDRHTFKGLHYVCPLLNGVAERGWKVGRCEVADVKDIKIGD